jgi:hypothetical protein
METMMVEEQSDVLNTSDRCDRCNGQAFFWVNGVAGDLLFCRHHFLKYEDAIRAYAFEIIDERHKLLVKRESSAANSD